MRHHYAHNEHETEQWTQVIVHPHLVDWLRRATYAEIGSAAEALDTAAFAQDREDHPERFRAAAQSLRESYALLDALGWAKITPPAPVPIDLNGQGWALMRVLNSAAEFADEETYEVSRDTDGQVMAGDNARVCELYDFTDDVRGRIDVLAVNDGAPAIPELAA